MYGEAQQATWTREHLGRFFAQVSDDRFVALWLLAATTGMTLGTLVDLRRHDIDLETERVRPTGRSGVRSDFALDPDAADALRAHAISWDKERQVLGHTTDKLFVWSNGEQLDRGSALLMFAQHCANAGVPLVPLKEVRAAYVINALQYGIPTEVLTERFGALDKATVRREAVPSNVTTLDRGRAARRARGL